MAVQPEILVPASLPETVQISMDAESTKQLVTQREAALKADADWAQRANTLVILPCLGSFKENVVVYPNQTITNDEQWSLWSFQKGETNRYIDDTKIVTERTKGLENALAVFSGGVRPGSGKWTEAYTAYATAEQNGWLENKGSRIAAACDISAYDSLTNILGSLVKFYELTGHYPKKLIIVGWDFKKERFLNLHLHALGLKHIVVEWIGGFNPSKDSGYEAGEATAVKAFTEDPYGMNDKLYKKKIDRSNGIDLAQLLDEYVKKDPRLQGLIDHMKNPDENKKIYTGVLPWNENYENEKNAKQSNYTPLPTSLAA